MAKVDAGSFLAIVLSAALAAAIVTAIPRRYAPPVVVVELVLGIIIGPNFLHLGACRRVRRVLLQPWTGDAVLLRRLRDRFRPRPWPGADARRLGVADVGRAGLRDRRCARGVGVRDLVSVRGFGAGDDRDRDADPDPPRRRRAADPLRHVSARGRRDRGVRSDSAADARALDAPMRSIVRCR